MEQNSKGKLRRVTVYLTPRVHQLLKQCAKEHRRTMADQGGILLEAALLVERNGLEPTSKPSRQP